MGGVPVSWPRGRARPDHRRRLAALAYAMVVAGVLALVLLSTPRRERDSQYAARIAAHRARIERSLRGEASPLSAAARDGLGSLDYYPPDPTYRVTARLLPIASGGTVSLATSAGATDLYSRHSWAELTLAGRVHKLLLLKRPGDSTNRLFLAFRDATSGNETYGGGRYLDLYPQGSDKVELDFNLAYNPYCVYDEGFSCPLAPPENTLDIAVRAGEKLYRGR